MAESSVIAIETRHPAAYECRVSILKGNRAQRHLQPKLPHSSHLIACCKQLDVKPKVVCSLLALPRPVHHAANGFLAAAVNTCCTLPAVSSSSLLQQLPCCRCCCRISAKQLRTTCCTSSLKRTLVFQLEPIKHQAVV
jgi:hypothetical protein